jgi:ribonuclease D
VSSSDAENPDAAEDAGSPAEQLPLLREPRDGVPEPVSSDAGLAAAIAALRAGSGPVAVDAERASGYRYSQRAYLIQLRRTGAGTILIDPISLPDLDGVGAAIADAEWILHAANQDLPCLAEVGMTPRRLFDTELAGRLLGSERVALGTMAEQYLGLRLEKGHSASDWSTRPLPHDWLVYAALDVELLIDLRAALSTELDQAGKLGWAEQEFEAVRTAPPPPARPEPWRRTSGIHRIRNRRQLAAIRALWYARDTYAEQRDIAPGRVLPDVAIVEAARSDPKTAGALAELPIFGGQRQRRQLERWLAALETARALPDAELPTPTAPVFDPVPSANRWRDRDPVAAQRLASARAAIGELAERHQVLAQNLLASDVVRRIAWQPPQPADEPAVRTALIELGARRWQVDLVAAPLTAAFADAATPRDDDGPDGDEPDDDEPDDDGLGGINSG